jgi:hypothetical protein
VSPGGGMLAAVRGGDVWRGAGGGKGAEGWFLLGGGVGGR